VVIVVYAFADDESARCRCCSLATNEVIQD